MASYTSTQSGDWNTNSTWGGGGHPVAGDTATIGAHTITCSGSCAVGASGATGSIAINHNSGGTLNVAAGGALTIFGDLDIASGFTTISGTLTINSPAGSQYKVITRFGGAKSFNCVGSSGTHAVITTAGLGTHGYIDLGATTAVSASSNISYCDVSNLGDTSNGFRLENCGNSVFDCAGGVTVAHMTAIGSGLISFGYSGSDGKETFTIDGLDIRTPVGFVPFSIKNNVSLASPGVRSVKNVTVYNGSGSVKSVIFYAMDTTFGVPSGQTCTTPSIILYDTSVDMANTPDRSTVSCYALISDLDFSGTQFVAVTPNSGVTWQNGIIYHHFSNPHTFQDTGSDRGVSPNTYQYNVCDGDGYWSSDSGDFVIANNNPVVSQYNIGINNCGTMWTSLSNVATATTTANHNTWFSSFGGSLGETQASATQLLSMQSNLIVKPAGNNASNVNGDGVHHATNSGFIRQSSFTMDYNGFWQIPGSGDSGSPTASLPDHLSSGGVISYVGFPQSILSNLTNKTATAGTTATNIACSACDFVTNGVQAGDYVVKGTFPNGTTTARVTARVDLHNLTVITGSGIGSGDAFDVVSSYSATSGAKYGDSGFGLHDVHANPGFIDSTRSLATWATSLGVTASVQGLGRAMVTLNGYDYTGATTTPVAGATVTAGLSYIRTGFTPSSAALKGTAHDGGDIGAVSVVLALTSFNPASRMGNRNQLNRLNKL